MRDFKENPIEANKPSQTLRISGNREALEPPYHPLFGTFEIFGCDYRPQIRLSEEEFEASDFNKDLPDLPF